MTKLMYQNVVMPEEGTFKFVIIQTDEGPKLRGGWEGIHKRVAMAAREREGIEGKILGGGRIQANTKEIYAYGYSIDFGEPPENIVEDLLRPYAEEKGCELTVEIGRGY